MRLFQLIMYRWNAAMWPLRLGHKKQGSFALLAGTLTLEEFSTMWPLWLPWACHFVRKPKLAYRSDHTEWPKIIGREVCDQLPAALTSNPIIVSTLLLSVRNYIEALSQNYPVDTVLNSWTTVTVRNNTVIIILSHKLCSKW